MFARNDARDVFPWIDKRHNLYDVNFASVSMPQGAFQAALDSQLAALKLVREIVDNQR